MSKLRAELESSESGIDRPDRAKLRTFAGRKEPRPTIYSAWVHKLLACRDAISLLHYDSRSSQKRHFLLRGASGRES